MRTEETPFLSATGVRALLARVFDECDRLLDAGQQDYAGGENALGNFVRLSSELGIPPEQVLWVFATKHKDAIAAYIRGEASRREPVTGRINDLITYLVLLRAMVEARARADLPSESTSEPWAN